MAADGDPALDRGGAAAADPRPLPPLALRQRGRPSSRTRRRPSASTRARGGWARDLLDRLGVPTRLFPRSSPPGTRSVRSPPTSPRRPGSASAVVVAAATHDTGVGRRGRPVRRRAESRTSASARGRSSGSRAEAPVINDAAYRANLTNEGGVDGTVPAAPQRHRALAPARMPPHVGGRRAATTPSTSWSRSRGGAGAAVRSSIPNDAGLREPGDMPARIAAFCARPGRPSPTDDGATVRCILESLALKHAETVDLLARCHRARARARSTSSAAARATRCSARGRPSAAGVPVLAGPDEATLIGNLLVQAMALGEIGSIAEAREVVRALVRADPRTSPGRRRPGRRRATGSRRSATECLARRGAGVTETLDVLHGIPAPETAGTTLLRPGSTRSTASSTARTSSAQTARSRTRAAATRRPRTRSSTTPAARCACSG